MVLRPIALLPQTRRTRSPCGSDPNQNYQNCFGQRTEFVCAEEYPQPGQVQRSAEIAKIVSTRVREPWEPAPHAAHRPDCGCVASFKTHEAGPQTGLALGLNRPFLRRICWQLASQVARTEAEHQCSQAFAAPESVAPEKALTPFHSGTGKLLSGCASVPWVF